MLRKVIALALAVPLSLVFLPGCGKDKDVVHPKVEGNVPSDKVPQPVQPSGGAGGGGRGKAASQGNTASSQ